MRIQAGRSLRTPWRAASALLGVVLLLAVLNAPAAGQGQVSIAFWHAMEGIKAPNLVGMVRDFMRENPTIKVDVTLQGSYTDMVRKVQAGIAANALPDLVMLGQRHGIPQISDSGRLIALDGLMTPEDRRDISPALLKRYTWKQKLMVMPFQISTPVLHINASRLREVGLSPDREPTTWDELVEFARRLTRDVDGDGRIDQWGFNTHGDVAWHIYAFIYQNGGDLYGPDGRAKLDSREVVEAVQFWSDLVHKHKVMPPLAHAGGTRLFVAGNLGIFQRSSAFIEGGAAQIGTRFDYRVGFLPKKKIFAVPNGGGGLGIFRSTPERERTATALFKWLTNTRGVARFAKETGYIAFRRSSIALPEMQAFFADNPRDHVAAQQLEYARSYPPSYADGAVWDGLETLLERIEADPRADIPALLRELNIKANRELARSR